MLSRSIATVPRDEDHDSRTIYGANSERARLCGLRSDTVPKE